MIIDSNSGINAPGGGAKNRVASAPSKEGGSSLEKAGGSTNSAKADVSLSNEAHTLSRLEAKIGASQDINASRVAELKQAIADGTFEVNAERIAEKMLTQEHIF
jgi:negative regulator of flagellin synthesis FlgM